jgi:hypothetical protein
MRRAAVSKSHHPTLALPRGGVTRYTSLDRRTRRAQNNKQTILFSEIADESRHATASV